MNKYEVRMKAKFKEGRHFTVIELLEADSAVDVILKLTTMLASIRTAFNVWYKEKPIMEVSAIVPYSG